MWILFWGSLISTTGQSLVWPFLTIHIRQQLGVPLTQITLLFTLQSLGTMAATAILGPAVDRFGRKWVMVLGPLLSAGTQIMMTGADTYLAWAVLLVLYASAGVGFTLGSQAMIADVIPPAQRTETYALMRVAANAGIAIGPTIGGFIISLSYTISFLAAAAIQIGLGLTALFLLRETLTDEIRQRQDADHGAARGADRGYGPLFRDGAFMSFWSVYLLLELAPALVFTLLSVYVKEQYGIPENQYGFIVGTNAVIVVVFQYTVTRITRRHRPLGVMAVSALFYAAGLAIFATGQVFLAFWLGIVIMSIGELIIAPTATTLVAALSPPDMRGRYMGVFGLSYRIGNGIGPVIAGWLGDRFMPAAIWYFGTAASLLAAGGFAWLSRGRVARQAEEKAARAA